jgi:hypothetical protein
MTTQTLYYTFERDGEIFDAEFNTSKEAQAWADDAFEQQCCDEGDFRNGDTASEEIEIIQFYYDDEGERIITHREESTVDFECYHGDFEEHNTLWNCI